VPPTTAPTAAPASTTDRATNDSTGAGTDEGATYGVLRAGANRHGGKCSQGRSSKNCLAHDNPPVSIQSVAIKRFLGDLVP
jgi:hypothetical protein